MAEQKFVFRSDKTSVKKIDASAILKQEDKSKVDTDDTFGYEDAEMPQFTTIESAYKTRTKAKDTYRVDLLEFSTEQAKGLSANLPVSTAGESLVGVPKGILSCDSNSLEFDNSECKIGASKINTVSYQYRGT